MTDEYLLAALRMAAGVDPAPRRATTDANAAFALRLPGTVLAEPSAVTETAGAGTRADGAPTMHRFMAEGITIDLEAAIEGGRLQVAGQVSPHTDTCLRGPWIADTRIEIRTPEVSEVRTLSSEGRFAVSDLPPGWMSLVWHRGNEASVATRWLRVRE